MCLSLATNLKENLPVFLFRLYELYARELVLRWKLLALKKKSCGSFFTGGTYANTDATRFFNLKSVAVARSFIFIVSQAFVSALGKKVCNAKSRDWGCIRLCNWSAYKVTYYKTQTKWYYPRGWPSKILLSQSAIPIWRTHIKVYDIIYLLSALFSGPV